MARSLKKTLGSAVKNMKNGAHGVWNKMTTLKPSKKAALPLDDYMQTDDMNKPVRKVRKTAAKGPKPAKQSGKFQKIKDTMWRIRNKAQR